MYCPGRWTGQYSPKRIISCRAQPTAALGTAFFLLLRPFSPMEPPSSSNCQHQHCVSIAYLCICITYQQHSFELALFNFAILSVFTGSVGLNSMFCSVLLILEINFTQNCQLDSFTSQDLFSNLDIFPATLPSLLAHVFFERSHGIRKETLYLPYSRYYKTHLYKILSHFGATCIQVFDNFLIFKP